MYVAIKSNPKPPSCKKRLRPQKRHSEKRCEILSWQPRNGCDGRLIAKILITTIQVILVPNLEEGNTNSPELLLLKFLFIIQYFLLFLVFSFCRYQEYICWMTF